MPSRRPASAGPAVPAGAWHPPTLRPHTASRRLEAPGEAQTGSSAAQDRSLLLLQRSRLRRSCDIPATTVDDKTADLVQELEAVYARRRGSSSRPTSATVRTRPTTAIAGRLARGEPRAEDEVLSDIDKQLRSAGTLHDIHDAISRTLDADQSVSTPPARYFEYRKRLCAAASHHPCVLAFVDGIFQEVDKYIRSCATANSVRTMDVATSAMRDAAKEASDAKALCDARAQQIRDLNKVVTQLVDANTAATEELDNQRRFIDRVRLAVGNVGLVAGDGDQAAAVRPHDEGAGTFVRTISQLEQEIHYLRSENTRLAAMASAAVEQHTTQGREMAELLDRANGFQTHVGHMKTTMRVMKSYIERLERRVFQLGDVAGRAAETALSRCTMESALSDSLSFCRMLSSVVAQGLATRGAGVGPHSNPSPLALVREQFSDNLPVHLRNINIPNLSLRPFGGVAAVEAYIDDALEAVRLQCPADDVRTMPFSQALWDTLMRRAPGNSVKSATELALSLHVESYRFSQESFKCFFFQELSLGRTCIDFLTHSVEHFAALKALLGDVEPTSRKQKDRIPRSVFVQKIWEYLPNMNADDMSALALSTVHGAVADGAKNVTDDVSYAAYFDPKTVGGSMVHDVLRRLMIRSAIRLVNDIASECTRAQQEIVAARQRRMKQERLSSMSADVRRMMKLDDSEIASAPDQISLAEWSHAMQAANPGMPKHDQTLALARMAACLSPTAPVRSLTECAEHLDTVMEGKTAAVSLLRDACASSVFLVPQTARTPPLVAVPVDNDTTDPTG